MKIWNLVELYKHVRRGPLLLPMLQRVKLTLLIELFDSEQAGDGVALCGTALNGSLDQHQLIDRHEEGIKFL